MSDPVTGTMNTGSARDRRSGLAPPPKEGMGTRLSRELDVAIARFLAMPPAWRWGGSLAAGLVLYFFTTDYLWSTADSLNERSNRIESALRDGKVRGKWISGDVREAVVALGPVAVPRAEGAGTEALGAAIREVFEANGVSGYSLDVRPGAPLPPTALRDVAGPSERIERLVGELRFTTTPDALAKIVAGLESRPEVESISRLKLAKIEADRKVQAAMTVEAWIRVPKRRAG
jgi:hypothetical protein